MTVMYCCYLYGFFGCCHLLTVAAIHVLECLKTSFHTVGIETVEATQSTERYTYRSPSSWGLAFSDGPVKERKAPDQKLTLE